MERLDGPVPFFLGMIIYNVVLLMFVYLRKKSADGLNPREDNLSGCGKQMVLSLCSSHRHLERATER